MSINSDKDTRGNRQVMVTHHDRTYTKDGKSDTRAVKKVTALFPERSKGRRITVRDVIYPNVVGSVIEPDDPQSPTIYIDTQSGNQIEGQAWKVDVGHIAVREMHEYPLSDLWAILPKVTGIGQLGDITVLFGNPEMTSGWILRYYDSDQVVLIECEFETVI